MNVKSEKQNKVTDQKEEVESKGRRVQRAHEGRRRQTETARFMKTLSLISRLRRASVFEPQSHVTLRALRRDRFHVVLMLMTA